MVSIKSHTSLPPNPTPHNALLLYPRIPSDNPNLIFERIKINKRAFGHVYHLTKYDVFGASENITKSPKILYRVELENFKVLPSLALYSFSRNLLVK